MKEGEVGSILKWIGIDQTWKWKRLWVAIKQTGGLGGKTGLEHLQTLRWWLLCNLAHNGIFSTCPIIFLGMYWKTSRM